MKKHFSTILLVLIFFVGLSVLLYPTLSDYINNKNSSRAILKYDETLQTLSEEEFEAFFSSAEEYNSKLYNTPMSFYDPSLVEGYMEALDVTGTGVMGYINIEKIDVMLPIYHTTDSEILSIAVGHMEGSSLPIGGENTHVVLSAHRGLPSAKLFTNLDDLEVKDTFTITVLDNVLTYEVCEIQIVEPDEVESLRIKDGKDMCTLVTCTPYGINTHRLLVHATRIENLEERQMIIAANGYKIDPVYVTPIVAAPILLGLLIFLLIRYRRKKKINNP